MVLAKAHVSELDTKELWVAFGTYKNFRYIPAHGIAKSLGPDKSFLRCMPSLATYLHLQPEARQDEIPGKTIKCHQRPSWLCQILQKAFQRTASPLWNAFYCTSSQINIDQPRLTFPTKKGRSNVANPPN